MRWTVALGACLGLMFAGCVRLNPAFDNESSGDRGTGDEGPVDEGPVDEGPVDEGPVDEGPLDDGASSDGLTDGPLDDGLTEEAGDDGPPVCALELHRPLHPVFGDADDGCEPEEIVTVKLMDEEGELWQVLECDEPCSLCGLEPEPEPDELEGLGVFGLDLPDQLSFIPMPGDCLELEAFGHVGEFDGQCEYASWAVWELGKPSVPLAVATRDDAGLVGTAASQLNNYAPNTAVFEACECELFEPDLGCCPGDLVESHVFLVDGLPIEPPGPPEGEPVFFAETDYWFYGRQAQRNLSCGEPDQVSWGLVEIIF